MGQFDQEFADYINDRLRAAESGVADALYDLGLMFSTGQGVIQDYVAAHMWFNLAAMRGVKRAQVDRAELAQEMSDFEIAEAQRQAREWLTSHAGETIH